MRKSLEQLNGALPDHAGLAYDMYAPLGKDGKIPDGLRDPWFQKLELLTVNPDYQYFFDRWRESLISDGAQWMVVEMDSRLLVGHGNPSPTEVGITLHHTWGVPMIPGSTLKGLLNHYLQITFGPDSEQKHPYAQDHPQKDRRDYQGVSWQGKKIYHGPGAVHRALFGAPEAETDEVMRRNYPELAHLIGASRGLVQFHDALYVPGSIPNEQPFSKDILTVHQKEYYNSQGSSWPNDYDDPNPVAFLTVRPKARFFIALTGPAQWTDFAIFLLETALCDWGIGGKTAAGYGQVSEKLSDSSESTKRNQAKADEKARIDAQDASINDSPIFKNLKNLKQQEAGSKVLNILNSVSPARKRELAREIINHFNVLDSKWLKKQKGKPWYDELLKMAEE